MSTSTNLPTLCERASAEPNAPGASGLQTKRNYSFSRIQARLRVLQFAMVFFVFSGAWFSAEAQTPPSVGGVVNAVTGVSTSGAPAVARGTIVTIFGNNLSTGTVSIPVMSPGQQVPTQ